MQLKGGQSQTVNGMPTGSVCTVTEPTQPGAPTGYSWWVSEFFHRASVTNEQRTEPEFRGHRHELAAADRVDTREYWKNHLNVALSASPTAVTCSLGNSTG